MQVSSLQVSNNAFLKLCLAYIFVIAFRVIFLLGACGGTLTQNAGKGCGWSLWFGLAIYIVFGGGSLKL